MSFTIKDHTESKRVKVINPIEEDLDRLIFPFKKHSITSLEYKPFSRFSLAKSLDEVFQNKLSKTLSEILNDRSTGTAIVEPDINNKKFDKDFLVGANLTISDLKNASYFLNSLNKRQVQSLNNISDNAFSRVVKVH